MSTRTLTSIKIRLEVQLLILKFVKNRIALMRDDVAGAHATLHLIIIVGCCTWMLAFHG